MTKTKPALRTDLKGNQVQCLGCGEVFLSQGAFDYHRTGRYGLPVGDPEGRRCRTVEEMQTAGMRATTRGWAAPTTAERKRALWELKNQAEANRMHRLVGNVTGDG